MLQQVWDNLNLRTKHRYQRCDDEYHEYNYDWMESLLIQDRINVNHMDSGEPLKRPCDLKIEDFIPSQIEKDYVFQGLVHYFASRLTIRYPNAFKSINSHIRSNKIHQFHEQMNMKSEEFTEDLHTKSESNTEDLIDMMLAVQSKYVPTTTNAEGSVICHERKIFSGDNKTEKNQTSGITR